MLEKEKFDASLRLRGIACKVQAVAALVGIFQEALEGSTNAASNYVDAVYAIRLYLSDVSNALQDFTEEFGGEA